MNKPKMLNKVKSDPTYSSSDTMPTSDKWMDRQTDTWWQLIPTLAYGRSCR